jgi:hypothetical protein
MPNDTLAYHVTVPVAEIVKDSGIVDGPYWVGTELVLARESPRGVVDTTTHLRFDAGEVAITRSSEVVPSSRQLGAIRIAAATRLVPGRSPDGDSVHVFVLMTNTSDRPAEVEALRGNPLWVQVYRSAAERDQIRTSPSTYIIPIGVLKDFTHVFTLGPGQRWLFERTVAVNEIVAAMGPGRAYFLTNIYGVPGYRTTLSAGDLELR